MNLSVVAEEPQAGGINWIVTTIQIVTVAIALASIIWQVLKERHKSSVDKSTVQHTDVDAERLRNEIQKMSNESNAWRDTRLWQLEGYLNLDAGWHLQMVTNQRMLIAVVHQLIDMVHDLGGDTDHIEVPELVPPPPPIPDPPKR